MLLMTEQPLHNTRWSRPAGGAYIDRYFYRPGLRNVCMGFCRDGGHATYGQQNSLPDLPWDM